MHSPYTPNPAEAFALANGALAATAVALAWVHRRTLRLGFPLFALGFVGTLIALPLPSFLEQLHLGRPLPEDFAVSFLRAMSWCFFAAVVVAPSSVPAKLTGGVILFGLWRVAGYLTDSSFELVSIHLCGGLFLMGLAARGIPEVPPMTGGELPSRQREAALVEDAVIFALSILAACTVGKYVLRWGIDSSDEWSYTFQASIFAKFESYSKAAPCGNAFRNFWVFDHEGRRFSQYTPGWPLFMVPFVWLRSIWLAGPVALGVLTVGVARLARRLSIPAARSKAAALSAATIMLSATALINGGSRFPHVWVAACLAWSLESLFAISDAKSRRAKIVWGAIFGLATVWMLATRVADGLLLGSAVTVCFVLLLVRRRLGLAAVVAGTVSASLLGLWTLWVLRQQLGAWFTTGYSLTTSIYPWNKLAFATPESNEWKWGIPLGTGAYSWFPASPALAAFGLARSRGRDASLLAVALFVSVAAIFGFYAFLDLGRGYDWGYGPRYAFATMVASAVGTGAALSMPALRLRVGTRSWVAGPAVLPWAIVTLMATARLAPLLYPINTQSVMTMEEVNDRIRDEGLHHVIVMVGQPTGTHDTLDFTQNLPLDLYPAQDVLITQPRSDAERECIRDTFVDRSLWEAHGNPVRLTQSPSRRQEP